MKKNYTKYKYQGNSLGKARLVQAIVDDYCKDNPSLSKEEILELFPKSLQGSIGVVSSIEEAEGKYKGKRHYVKSPIRLSNAVVAVCNQWGEDNIDRFINHASGMGFEIQELSGPPNENDSEEDSLIGSVVKSLNEKMDDVIKSHTEEFISSGRCKVRPGYGYDKFYLDTIDGSYDCSLHGLIHYILWEDKLYHQFLTDRQLKDVKKVIDDDPEAIYRPDLDDESISDKEYQEDQLLDENLDSIFHQVITHVGEKLSEFEFFDNSEFVDLGYVEEDNDDSEIEEYEEDNVDVDAAGKLCEDLSKKINELDLLSKAIDEGELKETSLSPNLDSYTFNFKTSLKIKGRSDDEIEVEEEDLINEILEKYFEETDAWVKLEKVGLFEDACGGFAAEIEC
ncbi:hypothetical protein N9F24_01245 [Akkermansiaceae bacterium]|nr:hypothetical protein [Akkermansiaceae bacterium]MDB4545656.1 hypothetical protein [Akkermansiaceae bacterium]